MQEERCHGERTKGTFHFCQFSCPLTSENMTVGVRSFRMKRNFVVCTFVMVNVAKIAACSI